MLVLFVIFAEMEQYWSYFGNTGVYLLWVAEMGTPWEAN